jgi:hypothetical protein
MLRRGFSDSNSSKGYDVGYGKPPKNAQFKPGQTGNPGGRPKGSRNANTVLRNFVLEEITITENGSKRRLTKLELIVKRLVDRGIDGDLRAIAMLLAMLDGPQGIADPQSSADQEDKEVVQTAIARMRKSPDDPNGQ